jgi:hypothetical protein
MRPQAQPGAEVAAFGEGLDLLVGQLGIEGIGIGIDALPASEPADGQAVVEAVLAARHHGLEETGPALFQRHQSLAAGGVHQRHLGRAGQQRPRPEPTRVVRMQAQPGEGIGVAACQQGVEVGV